MNFCLIRGSTFDRKIAFDSRIGRPSLRNTFIEKAAYNYRKALDTMIIEGECE